MEKRLERGAKGQATTANVLPIEAAYLEALRYANLQPELGVEKFRALIDLYNHRRDLTGPTGFCVELARRKLQALVRQIDRHAPVFLTNIEDCLDRADAIAVGDGVSRFAPGDRVAGCFFQRWCDGGISALQLTRGGPLLFIAAFFPKYWGASGRPSRTAMTKVARSLCLV